MGTPLILFISIQFSQHLLKQLTRAKPSAKAFLPFSHEGAGYGSHGGDREGLYHDAGYGQAEVGSLHPGILNCLPARPSSPQIPGPEGHVRSNL